jgi:hypothetical protein
LAENEDTVDDLGHAFEVTGGVELSREKEDESEWTYRMPV